MQAAPPAHAPAPARKGHKASSSSRSNSFSNVPTLVLDNGADRLKIGFAGDPSPRFLIPNCTAKLKGQVQVRRVRPITPHSSPTPPTHFSIRRCWSGTTLSW